MNYQDYSTEELGDIFSDFFKDVHGYRPRNVSFDNREGLIAGLDGLYSFMDAMKTTVEGRNQLRDDGWVINEPSVEADGWVDPEIRRAQEESAYAAELDRQAALSAPFPYDHLEYLEY